MSATSDIHIREMVIDDYSDVADLWRSVDGLGLGPSDSREEVVHYLARNPGMSFVAWDGPQLVGTVMCGTDGRRGYLGHLAVRSSHRRRGVGTTLVEHSLAALGAIGIPRCNLFVYADNLGAIAFWKRMGWRSWEDRGVEGMSFDIEGRD
jgi:N-acetylglutamate synthase